MKTAKIAFWNVVRRFEGIASIRAKSANLAARNDGDWRKCKLLLLMAAALITPVGPAVAEPIFSYTATPAATPVSFNEGSLGKVSYTLTNIGNQPLFTLTASFTRTYLFGDPLDFPILLAEAGPPDGAYIPILPGQSFKYEWVFGAIDDGALPTDSGVWLFTPFFLMAEGPFAEPGWLDWITPTNPLSNVVIQVNDLPEGVPEPSTLGLFGAGVFALGLVHRRRKQKALTEGLKIRI